MNKATLINYCWYGDKIADGAHTIRLVGLARAGAWGKGRGRWDMMGLQMRVNVAFSFPALLKCLSLVASPSNTHKTSERLMLEGDGS